MRDPEVAPGDLVRVTMLDGTVHQGIASADTREGRIDLILDFERPDN